MIPINDAGMGKKPCNSTWRSRKAAQPDADRLAGMIAETPIKKLIINVIFFIGAIIAAFVTLPLLYILFSSAFEVWQVLIKVRGDILKGMFF